MIKRKLKDFSYFETIPARVLKNCYQPEYRIKTPNQLPWTINDQMFPKFGNNKTYSFVKINYLSRYTHRCQEDGHYYHESWFIPDVLLEDELFEI